MSRPEQLVRSMVDAKEFQATQGMKGTKAYLCAPGPCAPACGAPCQHPPCRPCGEPPPTSRSGIKK